MMFSDKLVFLMNLTEVNSASLARMIDVDPSQISRLRTGVRSTPRKRDILHNMARVFSAKCAGDYQRAALSEMLGRNYIISATSQDEMEAIIFDWLSGNNTSAAEAERFLQKVGSFNCGKLSSNSKLQDVKPLRQDELIMYFGNSGRRYALTQVLNYMLSSNRRETLLISSDESTDWIVEDREFSDFYTSAICELAQRGCSIYRILPPLRTSNDALETISRWVPAYLSGNVYPCYFPRMRDGIYRRMLVIIPGTVALISSSTGWQYESGPLYENSYRQIVDNYEREFRHYMSMCRRALEVIDPLVQRQEFISCLRVNNSRPADRIFKCDGLSILSMPDSVAESFSRRASPNSVFEMYHSTICDMRSDAHYFDRNVTDIMRLASIEDIISGQVPCSVDDSISYTPEEYRRHISYIIDMLEKHERYNVVLSDKYLLNCGLAAVEGVSAQIFRVNEPKLMFDIESDQMRLAMWEFLCYAADSGYSIGINRRHTISALKDLLQSL